MSKIVKRKKLTKKQILHNILSSLNVVNNGGFYPIKHVIEIGFTKGLDEDYIRSELEKRAKDGFIIIEKEMMKLG